jgi:NADH-quinone oxidoreductase subunit C
MTTMENETFIKKLTEKHPRAVLGTENCFGALEICIDRDRIDEVVSTLRDDPEFGFNMLVDLVSIDYSAIPGRNGERFGLVYLLKSLEKGIRLQLKVAVPEKDPIVPTVSHLYANANWLEREAYDQMGIRFKGHPNLKRILNHHEFVGHPLRKDYPITRRQWLTANQSLMDEMRKRLKEKRYAS